MSNDKFDEIIDFAVEREKKAVRFYQKLQNMVNFSEKKKLLYDFEVMEKGHITILEKLRKKDIQKVDIPEVQNLHISDYIIQSKPLEEMSYQDILIIAMKREDASYKLYNDLAKKSYEEDLKKLFLKLATEEAKHKLMFEKIYDDEILNQD